MKMNMQPVSSSDLGSVGYEGGTLYIRFNSGGTYRYSGVPGSVYRGLMSAPSHGQVLPREYQRVLPIRAWASR